MNGIKKILTDAEWAEYQELKAKSQESKPAANADMVEELESLASEDNAYYMHLNGQKRSGISYVCRESLKEIIARYRPVKANDEGGLVEAKKNIEKAMKGITERQTQEDSYWRGYYNCLEETWDSLNVQISRHASSKEAK